MFIRNHKTYTNYQKKDAKGTQNTYLNIDKAKEETNKIDNKEVITIQV